MQAAQPAEAQQSAYYDGWFGSWFNSPYQMRQPRHRERRPEHRPAERHRPPAQAAPEPAAAEGRKPIGPLYAVVSLADQHVSFYDANGLWERSVVSTGVDGHPTPPGIFTILEKERWHRSNIYSGAPMPYMQRLTWTGVAMHEGVVTGRPASHGCVRLPGAFARRLFSATDVGQRVIISQHDVLPKDIENTPLPQPLLLTPPPGADDKIAAVLGAKGAKPVALDKDEAPDVGEGARRLNPAQFAKALKTAAAANAKAAAEAKKTALALAARKAEEARQATRAAAAAQESVRRASLDVEATNAALEKAQSDDAVRIATDQETAAEVRLAEAEDRFSAASEVKAAKDFDLTGAQNAVRDANLRIEAAAASAKDAAAREAPLSIFISRKTKHLYVRQGSQHLFDMPVSIRDPERPLGTHLLIATRAASDGAALHWVSLTTQAAIEIKRHRHSSRKGRKIEPEAETASLKPFPETAQAALDRIDLPAEARQRIAERLWVGATLIVSDVEMSGEGRYAMDFMILSHTTTRED